MRMAASGPAPALDVVHRDAVDVDDLAGRFGGPPVDVLAPASQPAEGDDSDDCAADGRYSFAHHNLQSGPRERPS